MRVAVLMVFGLSSMYLFNSCRSTSSSVEFCRDIDTKTLEGSNCSDTQATGNENIIFHNGDGFGADLIKVQIYSVNGSENLIEGTDLTVNPDWDTTALSYPFSEAGTYKVVFLTSGGQKITDAQLTVK
jgi:hypothetical protein